METFSDIDECAEDETICGSEDTTGTCINTAGSFICSSCEEAGDDVFSYYGEREGCCYLGETFSQLKSILNVSFSILSVLR